MFFEDLHSIRARQAIIPDLLIIFPVEHGPSSNQLAEIKVLNAGKTWYSSNEKAVDKKAKQVPKLYLDKAKKIDRKYLNKEENQIGLLQRRLQSYGQLQSLVVGQYGEVSQDLHYLMVTLIRELPYFCLKA